MKRVILDSKGFFVPRSRLFDSALMKEVSTLIDAVCEQGDAAVLAQREQFDQIKVGPLRVSRQQIEAAEQALDVLQRQALLTAIDNVRRFAQKQMEGLTSFEYSMGDEFMAGQRVIPVDAAAIYVPAGRFALPSSLIMGAVPAQVAGVKRLAVFSPPRYDGGIHPLILATASLLGIDEIYALGGVSAIAAAAYGTQTIPAVDMIVGPGNRYVTAAKKLVYGDVGIDTLAGPSEVLILADDSVPPSWIAADLLAQAEHDPNARALLFCCDASIVDAVEIELSRQLKRLPQPETARQSLSEHGLAVIFSSNEQGALAINNYAPEHLQLMIRDSSWWQAQLRHYGTLFIGPWSVEALADYCAGPNHTLPTARTARFASGLSVRNFVKLSTTLRVGEKGFTQLAATAVKLAEMEGLDAHKASLSCRIKSDEMVLQCFTDYAG